MADDDLDQIPEDFQSIGQMFVSGAFANVTADGTADIIANGVSKATVAWLKFVKLNLESIAKDGGQVLVELEDPILPIFAAFVAPIVGSMFGTTASPEMFSSRGNTAGRSEASAALVDAFMTALAGDASPNDEPSDEGAKRIAGAAVHASLEGWFNAWILEMLGEMVPWEWLKFKDMVKLPEDIIQSLGMGRLVRRAFAPLVDATAATPMKWKVSKTFRQNLLAPSEAIDLLLRGTWTTEQMREELARQGFSDDRADALKLLRSKHSSLEETLVLVREGIRQREDAIQELFEQGWDNGTAEFVVSSAETKRLAGIRDDALTAVKKAYANREIGDADLDSLLPAIIKDDAERTEHTTVAHTQRTLNVRHLTGAEVIDCVELGILPTAFYRDWLVREGYPEEEALALELRLRLKIDKQTTVEAERKKVADERAAEKAAKDAAAELRRQQLDAERALQRRGPIADLERAAVRGLIPFSRLEEVLNAQYDGDTVDIIVANVEADRTKFVADAKRADEARQRAERKQIDVGALEQAVLNHVLTIDEFRNGLSGRGFDAADVQILAATLAARLADLDAAKAKRAQAEAAAKIKKIDLGRAERLVRYGTHTLAEYDALLQSLGFDDASRAAMVELLQLDIAADAAAKKLRDEAAAKKLVKGLTLEQVRRAVLLGIKTDSDFSAWLVGEGYTSDAQTVLLAELRRDVTDADAARQKRAAAEAASAVAHLALSRVTQAARLGLITPAAYQARLTAEHFSADDIAIEMNLLVVEIADVQAARARRAQLAGGLDDTKALSLAQLENAVKLGAATMADYRTAAAAIYAPDDVDVLVATLQAELDSLDDARRRRTTITGELAARSLSLGELQAAVKAGAVSLQGYNSQLQTWGYGADDAELLTTLLGEELAKKAGA